MKKLLLTVLSLLLIVGMVSGCSGSNDDPQVETTAATTATTAPAEYIAGKRTTSSWQSAYMGLQYTLSSDLIMATEEELIQMMEVGVDMYVDSETGEKMLDYAKISTVYEMMVADVYGNSLLILAEKLPLSNMTVDQYITSLKTQMNQLSVTINYLDPTTRNVGGIDFTQLDCTFTTNGINLGQSYLLSKMGDRMVAIIVTHVTEGAFESLLAGFAPYSE